MADEPTTTSTDGTSSREGTGVKPLPLNPPPPR